MSLVRREADAGRRTERKARDSDRDEQNLQNGSGGVSESDREPAAARLTLTELHGTTRSTNRLSRYGMVRARIRSMHKYTHSAFGMLMAALALSAGCNRQSQPPASTPSPGELTVRPQPPQQAAGYRMDSPSGQNAIINTGPVTTEGPGVYGSEQPGDSRVDTAATHDELGDAGTSATPRAPAEQAEPTAPAERGEPMLPDVRSSPAEAEDVVPEP